jgi:hypothetical protein
MSALQQQIRCCRTCLFHPGKSQHPCRGDWFLMACRQFASTLNLFSLLPGIENLLPPCLGLVVRGSLQKSDAHPFKIILLSSKLN